MATRATRATRGKLDRALIELESFANADDVADIVTYSDQIQLAKAMDIVRNIESALYNGLYSR